METKMISYCGITCTDCDAYKATQAGDTAALAHIADAWNEAWQANFTAATVMCNGCLATEGPLCSHCDECPVRACAIDHGVISCAYCADYGCATLEGFLTPSPELRQALETMRVAYLSSTGD